MGEWLGDSPVWGIGRVARPEIQLDQCAVVGQKLMSRARHTDVKLCILNCCHGVSAGPGGRGKVVGVCVLELMSCCHILFSPVLIHPP